MLITYFNLCIRKSPTKSCGATRSSHFKGSVIHQIAGLRLQSRRTSFKQPANELILMVGGFKAVQSEPSLFALRFLSQGDHITRDAVPGEPLGTGRRGLQRDAHFVGRTKSLTSAWSADRWFGLSSTIHTRWRVSLPSFLILPSLLTPASGFTPSHTQSSGHHELGQLSKGTLAW